MIHMKRFDREKPLYQQVVDEMNANAPSELNEPVAEMVVRVRGGLPMQEFQSARAMLALSEERLADLLGMSRATLHRRKKAGHLDRAESDRLVRYVRVFARASEALGGEAGARSWLSAPALAFVGETPLDYCDTEIGAREVEALLLRLEHGVFS
jgi:putative toxin-antitoxin system antitoxin component (TIGR02293 family)